MHAPTPTTQPVANAGWDDRIHVFQHGRLVTVFAVVSTRYVVLIDTLLNRRAAAAVINTLRDHLAGRRLLVINTHADWDHCWGNGLFDGPDATHPAPIIAHRRCRERILSPESRAELAQMRHESPDTFADAELIAPSIVFDDSVTIDGGDLTFELTHTPGHQPDHISIYIPEIKTLFVGDAAEQPIPYLADLATLPALRESLQRLAAYDSRTAFYCHARGITSPHLIHANIAYFDALERRVRESSLPPRESLNDSTDWESLVGFPFEQVAGSETLDADERESYRSNHRRAIEAMIGRIDDSRQRERTEP
jgi:glyoxylase-like metal-dependent hydrolase (beta-lactamase superfamily II)